MKTHLDIAHVGTMGDADRTKMKFDENSIAHLMSVLTDLYSNPALAVIREYSTNALDAQLAAGYDGPIEVTLPTSFNAVYTVTDHGTGMSLDDITNHLSKYGWSSKRDNDDEVGMLGLGFKSALSYTSQFTMVSVHNGLQITVLVTRDGDGAGAIQIIDTIPTTEANGVTVSIPVKNVERFNAEALIFFSYWEEGTVQVNGKPSQPFNYSIQLDPDIYLASGMGRESVIIMGNIAYPIKEEEFHLENVGKVIVRVPIGTLNFTPSREQLHYTKRTRETLAELKSFIDGSLVRVLTAAIADADTPAEAVRLATTWRHALWTLRGLNRNSYNYGRRVPIAATWHNQVVPERFSFDEPSMEISRKADAYSDRSNRVSSQNALLAVDGVCLWVTGMKANHVGASIKRKARLMAGQGTKRTGMIRFVSKMPIDLEFWLDPSVPIVTIDDVKAVQLPVEPKDPNIKPKATTFNVVAYKNANVIFSRYDAERAEKYPLRCWVNASQVDYRLYQQLAGPYGVARILKSDEKKFFKEHPDVPTLMDYAAEMLVAPTNIYGWRGVLVRHSHIDLSWMSLIQPRLIADPVLRRMIQSYQEWIKTPECDVSAVHAARSIMYFAPKRLSLPVNPTLARYYKVIEPYREIMLVFKHLGRNDYNNFIVTTLNNAYLVRRELPEYIIPNPNMKVGKS